LLSTEFPQNMPHSIVAWKYTHFESGHVTVTVHTSTNKAHINHSRYIFINVVLPVYMSFGIIIIIY